MNLKRCSNGHFYDGDKYSACPYCADGAAREDLETGGDTVGDVSEWPISEPSGGEPTQPGTDISGWIEDPSGLTQKSEEEDDSHTISYYHDAEEFSVRPVVGWLVVLNGKEKGASKNLYTGMNFIGRGKDMDVVLSEEDKSVSRSKHAVVTFEPKSRIFIAMPGESHELYYVNGNVILSQTKLEPYDKLQIGKTELVFVPFCGERFGWDDGNKEEA